MSSITSLMRQFTKEVLIHAADNTPIDSDGNYADATYGRISLTHLLTTLREEGDTITFTVLRAGKTLDLPVILKRRPVEQYTVEPYVIDRAPKFYLLGGLVLQELSRQYLKEWGPDWVKKAPDELVYLDRQQNELYPEANRKIVFLSRILPSNATIGYEGLSFLIVSRINGQDIRALGDIPAALAAAIDGVHKVEFTTEPRMLFLDAEQVAQSEAILAKTYRLPSLKRL